MRIIALIMGLLVVQPVAAEGLLDLTPAERQQLRAEIRDFLVENPEILLEVSEILEEKQNSAQSDQDIKLVDANADALLDDGFSYVTGNPDGDITVVEFLDYQCGYCKRAHPDVKALIESDQNIRLIVKEFPILGPVSVQASRAALAVLNEQGPEKYGKFYDALMSHQGQLNEAIINKLALDSGVDTDLMNRIAADDKVAEQILETRSLASEMQLTGTPSFIIGKTVLRGYLPLEDLRSIVAQERAGG